MPDYSWRFLSAAAKFDVRRNLEVTVEGAENLPASGPAILASRHYHHLHDGAALLAMAGRPTRILVGLDWIENPALKRLMENLCQLARWPIVQRRSARRQPEFKDARQVLRAMDQCVEILRRQELLVIFPEGYPTIDPGWTPKTRDDELLPFQPGLVHLARRAERAGVEAPIFPVGLEYHRNRKWKLIIRIGTPVLVAESGSDQEVLQRLEADVRGLSRLPSNPAP